MKNYENDPYYEEDQEATIKFGRRKAPTNELK